MIVISDTSPILNLAAVEKLHILRDLYCSVFIPSAVAEELSRNGFEMNLNWIHVRSPRNMDAVLALREVLDLGESESIVLAQEQSADLLLIDERRGWKVAIGKSLRCVGLLGVLAEAKQRGIIALCRPILEEMIKRLVSGWGKT